MKVKVATTNRYEYVVDLGEDTIEDVTEVLANPKYTVLAIGDTHFFPIRHITAVTKVV